MQKLLRPRDVAGASGKSRSALYANIAEGLWTKPVKIGPRASAWPEDEVAALNAARIAGKTDDEIRSLVVQLQVSRKTLPLRLNQGSVETATQGG
jgi:prophage regulatory protein